MHMCMTRYIHMTVHIHEISDFFCSVRTVAHLICVKHEKKEGKCVSSFLQGNKYSNICQYIPIHL
jgi:hypothetical protein